MKKILTTVILSALALLALACSKYDSGRVEAEITALENSISGLEAKADSLTREIGVVQALTQSEFITRLSFDEKGNCCIRYVTLGVSNTVTFATASSVVTAPLITAGRYDDGKLYWQQSIDYGKTWTWIKDSEDKMMPVIGAAPSVGIDADGYWTVNGESTLVLAQDQTYRIITDAGVNEQTGKVDITLAGGNVISLDYREALSISFDAPIYTAVEDYGTVCTISYSVSGFKASDAVVDYFTAYNTAVTVNRSSKCVSVQLKEGAADGNVIFMASAGDDVVYQPLFFTYGKIITDLESYIRDNELITPMGEPVINLNGQMTPFTINVSHNIDVEPSVSQGASSWLHIVSTKADPVTTSYQFTADYYEADEDEARSAYIIFTNSLYGSQTKFTVSQKPVVIGGGGGGGETKGISSKSDLLGFVAAVNAGGSTARWENESGEVCLLKDIDLSEEESWTPAGFAQAEGSGSFAVGMAFKGVFNGQNHTISGFHFSWDVGSYSRTIGFFGALDGAVVKNLILGTEGDSFTLTGNPMNNVSVGGVAGYAVNTTMTNVVNNIDIIYDAECSNGLPVGLSGIVGYGCNLTFGGKTKTDAVTNNADVIVKYKVATTQNGAKGIQVGGITGMLLKGKSSSFRNCRNNGLIASPTGRGGGLFGTFEGSTSDSNPVTVSSCVNAGFVTDDYYGYGYTYDTKRMGGIIGGSQASDVVLENCTNSGNVFSRNGCRTGGMAGHFNKGSIIGCINEGAILSHVTPKESDGSGGDGPGWVAGYCNTTIENCSPGGYVGEYADFKDNPTGAPAADLTNAIGYKNSQYFDPSKNQ